MAREPHVARPVTLEESDLAQMSKNERIKVESKGLFYVSDAKGPHTFAEEVRALESGEQVALGSAAKELSKFFGFYMQQGRGERGKKTQDFFFMVRIRNPGGGKLASKQWLALDDAADRFGDGTLRITSRQGIQYHHVYGPELAPLVRHLNRHYRDRATLGACGDVNRNVMSSPIDALDPEHACGALELAEQIAEELAPRTGAYFEIFRSDREGRNNGSFDPREPLYGESYLPRKFKIGIAHPADGSNDILTQDIGLNPVVVAGRADGSLWDVYTGGGMGQTHNNPETAPLLGIYIGRVRREQVIDLSRAILTIQKEKGERKNRKQARWKYTLRRLGVDAVREELRARFKIDLEDAEPQPLPLLNLHLGWHEQRGGGGYYGISVQNGRLAGEARRGIRRAVQELGLGVVLTAQQDLILCDVKDRVGLEKILDDHGIQRPDTVSKVRANSMACPAKPTCGLAMTEAETILPHYLDAIEAAGYGEVDAVIRMTGCPNGCARPPTAEIGIYGYGKSDHVILVGGARDGSRLAEVLYGRISEEKMVPVLVGLFRTIHERMPAGLDVGDFLHRADPAQLRAWIGVEDDA
jgi:sulfite reductase (ferredoxin)